MSLSAITVQPGFMSRRFLYLIQTPTSSNYSKARSALSLYIGRIYTTPEMYSFGWISFINLQSLAHKFSTMANSPPKLLGLQWNGVLKGIDVCNDIKIRLLPERHICEELITHMAPEKTWIVMRLKSK